MRAWQFSSFGLDSLEFVEKPTPDPGPGEVLVRVCAVSLNYRDLLVIKGKYNPRMKLPRIPCSDGAGEVVSVGEGVSANSSFSHCNCWAWQQLRIARVPIRMRNAGAKRNRRKAAISERFQIIH